MSNLNKDGLPIGQPVSFEDIQRINSKRNEAVKNGNINKQPKIRKSKQPSISDVQEAAGQKEA